MQAACGASSRGLPSSGGHDLASHSRYAVADPDHGRLLDGELHGDSVGRHQADAADDPREAVGS